MGVTTAKNAAGDIALGVEEDGVFIPLATVPANRVEHLKERHANLTERAEQNDDEALKALEEGFSVDKPEPEPVSEPTTYAPSGEEVT